MDFIRYFCIGVTLRMKTKLQEQIGRLQFLLLGHDF